MKQLILFVILINVFVAPWGLAASFTTITVTFLGWWDKKAN